MAVLSPWAAELLKTAPPSSSLLQAPGSVAPSPSAGSGPIGEHVSLPSMVSMMGRQRQQGMGDPSLTAILAAISESLAERRGRGPGTRGPGEGVPVGVDPGAATGDPSSADGDTPPGGGPPVPRRTDYATVGDMPEDFNYDDYIQFVSALESGGSYTIPNQMGSGAYGRYQFMPATLQGMGVDEKEFRRNPAVQDAVMKAFTKQNYDALRMSTGLEKVDPATMYLAHWFGPNGATQILFASPMTSMSKLVSKKAIAQNGLEGKTTGDVIDMVRRKYQLHAQRSARAGQGE